jgi:uncharacterized protein (TIGR03083 family)
MTTKSDSAASASYSTAVEPLPIAQHIDVVAAEGAKFAAAGRRADFDAAVPSCPGWNVRDLVRHLGEIHLWAAGNVAQRPGSRLDVEDREELARQWPDLAEFWPDDADLVDWYQRTNDNLVAVLRSAPADVAADTFLPAPSPLAMWARRQAHETSIHRFDAEIASGPATSYDPLLAADGIDELLYGFYRAVERSRKRPIQVNGEKLIHVHADDTDNDWYMHLSPNSISWAPAGGEADLTITGTASDLYKSLWNRGNDSSIAASGERRLLEAWHDHTGVRWYLN